MYYMDQFSWLLNGPSCIVLGINAVYKCNLEQVKMQLVSTKGKGETMCAH